MTEPEPIEVVRSQHGPFERIVLRPVADFKISAVSVYRIGDTLIDSAGSRVAHALIEALRDNPPKRILCTHQHEDHVGGVGMLRHAFGDLPVHIAAPYLALLPGFDRVPPYRAKVWGDPLPIADAIGFEHGAVFEAGGVALTALETAGHTPHHISFAAQVDGSTYALTGDLYTAAQPLVAFFESAADDTVRSCRAVAAAGPDLQMLPTHGRVRSDGAAVLHKLADFMAAKSEEVNRMADTLGTRDYRAIAALLFPDDALHARHSENEFSYENFVRSVLDPVRALPARRLTRGSTAPKALRDSRY